MVDDCADEHFVSSGRAQTGTGQSHQIIACLGYQLLFHMAAGADKKDIHVRMTLFEYIGHGDGRVDMAAGTAAGKNHIHRITSCFFI